jgi:hypothetical protein
MKIKMKMKIISNNYKILLIIKHKVNQKIMKMNKLIVIMKINQINNKS